MRRNLKRTANIDILYRTCYSHLRKVKSWTNLRVFKESKTTLYPLGWRLKRYKIPLFFSFSNINFSSSNITAFFPLHFKLNSSKISDKESPLTPKMNMMRSFGIPVFSNIKTHRQWVSLLLAWWGLPGWCWIQRPGYLSGPSCSRRASYRHGRDHFWSSFLMHPLLRMCILLGRMIHTDWIFPIRTELTWFWR